MFIKGLVFCIIYLSDNKIHTQIRNIFTRQKREKSWEKLSVQRIFLSSAIDWTKCCWGTSWVVLVLLQHLPKYLPCFHRSCKQINKLNIVHWALSKLQEHETQAWYPWSGNFSTCWQEITVCFIKKNRIGKRVKKQNMLGWPEKLFVQKRIYK